LLLLFLSFFPKPAGCTGKEQPIAKKGGAGRYKKSNERFGFLTSHNYQ